MSADEDDWYRRANALVFCPLCGVVLDLHDGPDTCHSAEMKANMLSLFDRMIGKVVFGER